MSPLPYSPFPFTASVFYRPTRSGLRHKSCLINGHGHMRSLPWVHYFLISTLEPIDRILRGWRCCSCLFSQTVVFFLVFLVVAVARTRRNVEPFFSYSPVTSQRWPTQNNWTLYYVLNSSALAVLDGSVLLRVLAYCL